MDVLAQALRGAITATPGKVLYVADYAAIEARVVLWLAEDYDALEVFRTGKDIYCEMASTIYKRPINKKEHPDERQLGKVAILGLGFQMGASKFVDSAASYGITLVQDHWCADCGEPTGLHWKQDKHHDFRYLDVDDPDEITAAKVVAAYRDKFWRVKEMWRNQEDAAIFAVRSGEEVYSGRVKWFTDNGFLYCMLPSGRCLGYPEPLVEEHRTSWGAIKPMLTFMGVNPLNRQWQRQKTYGGSLVENITQAVARDLMAEAVMRCEQSGLWVPVLTVHDELIAEGKSGLDVKAFERLMAATPPWADGCPVDAEGWSGFRYRK
jgi:DNA polymerase